MALNSTELTNLLVNNLQNLNNPIDAQTQLCDTIAQYIQDHYIANGDYTGVNSAGNDPNNGSYTISVSTCSLDATKVFSGLNQLQDPTAVLQLMSTQITTELLKNLRFSTADNNSKITVAPPVAIFTINFSLSKANNPADALKAFADSIVSGLQAATVAPSVYAASSKTGSGAIVYSTFE
jgi:glutamate-1-semialdehyde aminotransferase